jgi:Tol biopolymer transport system component
VQAGNRRISFANGAYPIKRAIITVHAPLSGITRLVHSAPATRADVVPARSPAARPYLIVGYVLSALLLSQSAAAQTVAEVQVTPETMTLGVGQKQALFATAFDSRGNILPTAKFTFRSSDTLVAQVRSDGTVIGIKPGLAKIEARAQGKSASMAVLITGGGSESARPSPAAVLTLEPASLTLFPGETARFRAQALKEDGTPVSIGRVTIKSLRPEVARVDSGGLVTGLTPGRTIIQAAAGRVMATLPVEVVEAEFTVTPGKLFLVTDEIDTLRVMVPSQGNRQIRGLVQWISTDSSVVSVSPAGVVRAHRAGQAEIIARAGQQERRVPVTIHRVPDALVVSPPQGGRLPVPLNSTRQFTAVAEAADSTPIPEARVVWQLSDTTVAAFDPITGVLTPKALGTTTLTATVAGITPAVWTVHVVAGEIAIDPIRLGLQVAQRTTLSVLLRDQDSPTSSLKAGVQWSSDRPDVATVAKNGIVEGVSPGHAVVTATVPWGKTATADVFVVGDLLVSSNRSGSFGVYQMTASGPSSFLPVLVDNASNIQAVFSPDRTRIAFSSNRNGNYDIYLMDSDGQRLRRLTSSPAHEGDPAWTPDGNHIVYTITSGTTTHIAIMSSEGTEHRQLTSAAGGNHSPTIAGDGRTIAFVSARDGNHAIYTMGLDGSNQRRVTRSSARETSPRFSRNGDLFYVTERGGGSRGSKVVRMAASGASSQLLQTEDPISSLAVSREGDRLAYIVGRIRDASRARVDFRLFIQPAVPNRPPVAVPLQPGEQVSSPSF